MSHEDFLNKFKHQIEKNYSCDKIVRTPTGYIIAKQHFKPFQFIRQNRYFHSSGNESLPNGHYLIPKLQRQAKAYAEKLERLDKENVNNLQ